MRRVAVATAASAALAGGLIPLLPTSASAVPVAQETVVPSQPRNSYMSAAFLNSSSANGHDSAGAQGVFHRVEGSALYMWTRYADGESVPVPVRTGVSAIPTGSDVLAYRYADGRVEFWNAADGTTQSLQMPAGTGFLNPYDNLVVGFRNVAAEDGTSTRTIHLLTPGVDGGTRDVTVGGGPAGLTLGLPAGADARSVFLRATLDGESRLVAVDRESGQVQSWSGPLPIAYSKVWISPDHVVVAAYDKAKVMVFPRADLSATPAEVVLRNVGDQVNSTHDLAVVGDWLVNGINQVVAQPIGGDAAVTLMPSSSYGMVSGQGGTAVKIGRTGADDWGIQRIAPGPDGAPVVTQVKPLPKPPVPVQGISLDQGRLVVTDTSRNGMRDDYVRTVAVTGSPEYGERGDFTPRLTSDVLIGSCDTDSASCAPLHGTADGRIVWLEHGSETAELLRVNGPTAAGLWQRAVPAGGRVTDVSGRYVLYTAADKQYAYAIGGDGTPALTRTPGAAALSGDVLWTAGSTPGTVTAYDLTAKKTTETLTTDAGCTPTELQALGRWIYWTCDGRAGVFDRTAKKSVAVPADEAKLGDGYVVTHDKAAGKLTLTAVAGGSAESLVIGDLPDTGVSQRDVRWTVDESGANAAYVDGLQRVHLVASGVAQQPLRLLTPAQKASYVEQSEIDTTPDTLTTLLLSKPSSSWRLTVRNKAGKVVDTQDGGAARGELSVGWSGVDRTLPGDVLLPNGSYDWTLSVTPADGVGGPLEVGGTVGLRKAAPARHDHTGSGGRGPDGIGDLLTLNSSGGLTFQQGDGKGAFAGKVTGNGWSTKAVAVPFGDLNGDRCNDVLVRMSDGSLRGYKPACGTAPTPSTSYKALGTGWNAYNVLTSPGDLTGDRRPDLLARKASTGDLYLFAAKSDGTLAAGKKIRTAWTGYTKIVGAGDLNGDGIGDVLARDKAGTLYRYNGTGTGLLKDRVKVFSAWGASYNAIVGVGDITGDGKNDLVERDTSGNVYRNAGTGTGSFGSRVKITGGWQGYKGLF
ncbi:VCBS repeat-containing protein [Streptomyces rhizosphaerihabitans]|uniref:VCBS repeat-containing protein n=1 Tax=Streptomyces rhizosphaerihabitans TaxID=1266770 RepID=UPI0021BF0C71|nr:VCBS repeat-containing protein [Streptomyces rhizosphaerihabitans]MCT9010394.1 VCBS repeat-containing protein [Streptomyces rhizosphaerihabitans]